MRIDSNDLTAAVTSAACAPRYRSRHPKLLQRASDEHRHAYAVHFPFPMGTLAG
jgi:hypothetical protein